MTERSCPCTHTYCFCTIHWRSSKNRHTTFSFTTKKDRFSIQAALILSYQLSPWWSIVY